MDRDVDNDYRTITVIAENIAWQYPKKGADKVKVKLAIANLLIAVPEDTKYIEKIYSMYLAILKEKLK